jgi:hypothetical protein
MRLNLWLGLLLLPVVAGCARFPSTDTTTDVPPVTLVSDITVRGGINNNNYYFLALNTDADPVHGPVPVKTVQALGNYWGVISGYGPDDPVVQPPYYVLYFNGHFEQYLDGQPIGPPYAGRVSSDGKSLHVEIDARTITAAGTVPGSVELNWITTDTIIPQPESVGLQKNYDGFGATGDQFLEYVPLTANRTWQSGVNGVIDELPSDQNNAFTPDIDMTAWRVEVRLL